jgi:metal-responsive CopG/Arc/MetJ family transcriptional regulator
MSRRRSADPTKAISITLPLSLLEQIDDQLTRTSSRSLWIASACKMRLDEDDTLGIETRQLLAMLHARATSDGDTTLATLLLDRLTS